MSCNGCRVLRKGCSDTCTLRPCLQWIDTPEAQGHATVFVAKFFGRAGLMSFIGAVPESQRPALFQSLLYEACGRTVNPVHGAVGLLWSNNWHICQGAVETVLKGGTLRPATSLPAVSNPLPCLPAMPVSSIHRMSKMPAVPEAGALTLSSSEPSSSVARCSTEAFRPKRPLDEPKMGAAERRAAGSSQERTDGKRCRAEERESSVAKLDFGPQEQQQQPPPKINPPSYWDSKPELSKQAASTATECNDLRKREKSPSMAGQLVAPVPIRVRPRLDDTEFHAHIRSGRGQATAIHDGTLARSSDKVELDLSLNSIPSAPFSFVRMKPGFMRVSSPSTISVNSEGSVTSLDTADLSMSPWRRRSSCSSPKQQEQKLLDLLL